MIKGLPEIEKYKVTRPIFGDVKYDEFSMPIIKKIPIKTLDWNHLSAIGVQNLSPKTNNADKLVLMFNYDKKLIALWNNPLKKIGLFQSCAAISTPDFSLYPKMNINEIRHNIFMARWLGVTWQNYDNIVIPTIGWAKEDTYDICFSGIEKESVVIISTLGCCEHKDDFLKGFEELKRRINPPLIIVFGEMIDGMTGTFLNYKYKDCLAEKYEQLKIEGIPSIFTIKEVK